MFGLRHKEERFYDLFSDSAGLVCKAAKVLEEIMVAPETLPDKMKELTEIEHQGDEVTAAIINRLNQTLITPMDREDIYTLAQSLDDIIDFLMGSAERMLLYKAGQPKPAARELTRLLVLCTDEIYVAFGLLRNMRGNSEQIINTASKLNQLESEGDKIYRQEVGRLFEEEKDPITVIKWKEILEHLETALDFCEDVGDLLKGAVLKYA